MISNIMKNPMFQNMITDIFSDPDALKGILSANPILTQMAQGNPEIEELLNNPEKIKDAMKPEHLEQAIKGMQDKLETAQTSAPGSGETQDGESGPAPGMAAGAPGAFNPMMGQFDPEMLGQLMSGFSLAPQPGNCEPAAELTGLSKEEMKARFSSQLETMEMMGFTDEDSNIELLKQTGGNAQAALELALEKLEES
uniref:UBA domain-containing protein n=1 Tax=Euplotes harpa TaxID=151035 RepID=A0A7S3JH12_9SPIT